MPTAFAGSAPATFEIKSANLPLISFLLKSADLAAVTAEWKRRFDDIPDFFDDEPMVLDLSPLAAETGQVPDVRGLLALLRRYRVVPLAFRGGSQAQAAAARAAGLVPAPDTALMPVPTPALREDLRSVAKTPPPEPKAMEPPPAGALLIDKPLRSGQQIYARGRDLVVMAMVNPGAEVIADGHVHVYAPLRGKAVAGARGNTGARIFSLCLQAQLISISGIYRTSETPLPAEVRGKPVQIRLEGERLLIEALKL